MPYMIPLDRSTHVGNSAHEVQILYQLRKFEYHLRDLAKTIESFATIIELNATIIGNYSGGRQE